MTDLTDTIQRGWATADADAPEPTVTYFHNLLGQHPEDRHALFAYASALDFAGRGLRPGLQQGVGVRGGCHGGCRGSCMNCAA